MVEKLVPVFVGLLVCWGLTIGSTATAQNHQCHHCGCSAKPKTKTCLVKTFKQVSIPDYACNSLETFYPQKGMVVHQRNANDAFVVQRKDRCGEACLDCKSKTGCECVTGACPGGCHQATSVRQPVGATAYWVPVVKWKKIKCCPDCGVPPTEHLATQSPPIVQAGDIVGSSKNEQANGSDR